MYTEAPTSRDFYQIIARYYDAETADMLDDLSFYSQLVEEYGGPVLEIGCGTGRVTLQLAQEGTRVVGVEYSEAMLERAERKLAVMPHLRPAITLVRGDAAEVSLPERFSLAIIPFNSFMQFYTQVRQIEALKQFREHLLPGGVIAFDMPNPSDLYATSDTGAVTLERIFTEPESGHVVMQQSVSTLDRAEQMMHVTWIYDELLDGGVIRRTLAPLRIRYIFPAEMDLLLGAAGLERVERYGDYDFSPFEDDSPRMIVLAGERKNGA